MTMFFKQKYPERFFQMGIAESNMMGVATGLAASGKKAFVSTFAIFGSRAWEQIRNTVARGNFPVALCFSHTGITVGEDGASAQACEDIAIMRAIPHMRVFVPADGPETEQIIEYLAENMNWPAYVRLTRNKVPIFHDQNYRFQFGRAEEVIGGKDLCVIACGQVVQQSIKAIEILQKEDKLSIRLLNMSTIKPIDADSIIKAARETGKIVTVEEHTIIGGLGEAVCGVVARQMPVPVCIIGLEDVFGESGKPDELLEKYGLDAESIVRKIRQFLGK
jgi:transketolase